MPEIASYGFVTRINITDEEYQFYKALVGTAVYICGKRRLLASSNSAIVISHATGDVVEVNNISLSITNPAHLRLLTDQIIDLSQNYKHLSVQLLKI